jgi:three-Cys-motif partner protein
MSRSIKVRAIQTEVKHVILRKYLKSWGGIILGGISRKGVRDAHFIYVDANAYRGWYPGNQSAEISRIMSAKVYGSPIIGIEALDELVLFAQNKYSIRLRVNMILVEENVIYFRELVETLRQKGYDNRLVINPPNLASLTDKQIAVINGDSTAIVEDLVRFTSSGQKFSLYFLDPWGASGIPLKGYVDKIISRRRHDVIINFPFHDLHLKTGLAQRPELRADQGQRLMYIDRMYGHERWRTFATDIDEETDQREPLQLEPKLFDNYRDTLSSVDSGLAVKSIRMRFPERERTMYYLFLTTHDPTGALAMNKLLWDAKLMENELRWQLREKRGAAPEQLPLFHTPAPPPTDQPKERPSKEEIANHIFDLLQGRRLVLREVYRTLADEPYFDSEVDSALRQLRRQKRARFSGDLGNETVIEFQ